VDHQFISQCFEGIPEPYDKMKRMVVPEALRINKIAPGRRYCVLGRLSKEVGWNYGPLIERLEETRKAASEEFYQAKKTATAAAAKKAQAADTSAVDATLAEYGY
jgi:large subunit ribosomal protein L13Ae